WSATASSLSGPSRRNFSPTPSAAGSSTTIFQPSARSPGKRRRTTTGGRPSFWASCEARHFRCGGQRHDHQQESHLAAHGPSRHRRSEEHTSELQSPDHLVCRLLLEKKNT